MKLLGGTKGHKITLKSYSCTCNMTMFIAGYLLINAVKVFKLIFYAKVKKNMKFRIKIVVGFRAWNK